MEKTEKNVQTEKKPYITPQIKSEKLNSYGALCNGTTGGGKKASTGANAFCNANRLNS